MSTELVLLHHNEPMTTSLAIAEGTENTHKSVIQLIRKYVEDLQEFGSLAFEMRVMRQDGRGGELGEVAYLNEQQSTLLITYLRNTDTVRRFKIALVKAFYELRDRLRVQTPQFTTRQLDHGADLAVAADRTFRSFMRAGRSAGLSLQKALRTANDQTLRRTGMNMLAELSVDLDAQVHDDRRYLADRVKDDPIREPLEKWLETAGEGPWRMLDILGAAIGMPPGSKNYNQTTIKAALILRSFGLSSKKSRSNGGTLYNHWYRT